MFCQEKSEIVVNKQIFAEQISTYRKINALKQKSLTQNELQSKFLYEHLKWVDLNSYQNHGNNKKVDRSYLKSSIALNMTKQNKNSPPTRSLASSRLGYRRGHQVQRNYYQDLIEQLAELQKNTPHLQNMDSNQILQYRKKYLDDYFSIFLKQTQSECTEKSNFIKKLYRAIQSIMLQIFDKLYQQMFKNEKYYLTSALSTHKQYQQRIQKLNNIIVEKDEKIKLFQQNFERVKIRDKQKLKKNKNLSASLIKAGQKIIEVQDQKSCLQTQYINMLTIGFKGGMSYQEACAHVSQKIHQNISEINLKGSLKNKIYQLKQMFYPKVNKAEIHIEKINCHNLNEQQNILKLAKKHQRVQVDISTKEISSYGSNFQQNQKYSEGLIRNISTQTVTSLKKATLSSEKCVQWLVSDIQQLKTHFPIFNSDTHVRSTSKIINKTQQQSIIGTYKEHKCQSQILDQLNQISEKNCNVSQWGCIQINDEKQKDQGKEKVIKNNKKIKQNKQKQLVVVPKRQKKIKNSSRSSNFKAVQSKNKPFNQRISNLVMNKKQISDHKKQLKKIHTQSSQVTKKSQEQAKFITGDDSSEQSADSFAQSSEPEPQKQEDYQKTELFSVIENMHNVSPSGIYIDETMLFLLKKSLFSVKHESTSVKTNQTYKKNSKFINKLRSSICNLDRQRKNSLSLITIKNVIKLIVIVYENAHSILHSTIDNKQIARNKIVINLLEILKQAICKEHSVYKMTSPQIQNKLAILLKSMECYSVTNYLIKNFILLSCLDDNIYSPIIFTSDIRFYFGLLTQLNVNQINNNKPKLGHKSTLSGGITLSNSSNNMNLGQNKVTQGSINFETCYTTVSRLQYILNNYVQKYFKKTELIFYISKKVNEILQRSNEKNIQEQTRLDIYKCSQLIMEALLSFKMGMLKSYSKLGYVPDITVKSLITQELLIDLLGFMQLSKLDALNIVNRFRYSYGKKAATTGVSLITFVNFCMANNFPDFDTILVGVHKYSCLPSGVSLKQIQKHPKIDRIQKIAQYFNAQQLKTGKQIFISAAKLVHAKIIELQSTQLLQKILGQNISSIYVASLCQLEQKRVIGEQKRAESDIV